MERLRAAYGAGLKPTPAKAGHVVGRHTYEQTTEYDQRRLGPT